MGMGLVIMGSAKPSGLGPSAPQYLGSISICAHPFDSELPNFTW